MESNQDPQGNPGQKKRFNWNLLGQLLAAAGVVVSLIFVGYEIRQNTAVARSAAAQAFTQQIIDINAIIVSGDMPQINARLEAGGKRADFTPEEQFILDINLISLVRVWESLFRSVQEGIVEQELLERWQDQARIRSLHRISPSHGRGTKTRSQRILSPTLSRS